MWKGLICTLPPHDLGHAQKIQKVLWKTGAILKRGIINLFRMNVTAPYDALCHEFVRNMW